MEATMPTKYRETVNRSRVVTLFHYDVTTGKLYHRLLMFGGFELGEEAGSLHSSGYRYVSISSVRYVSHRLVWFIVFGSWPDGEIDHINGVRDDNHVENLRLATRSENAANRKDVDVNLCRGVAFH